MKKVRKDQNVRFCFPKWCIFIEEYLRGYLLGVACIMAMNVNINAQGGPPWQNCMTSAEDLVSMPHPISSAQRPEKCIYIKFHDINVENYSSGELYESDIYWNDLLNEVNTYYSPGNIRWVFGENCIHRAVILGMGQPNNIPFGEHFVNDNNEWDPDPDVAADDNAINVYFIPGANRELMTNLGHPTVRISERDSASLLAHELGHALNLIHTQGMINSISCNGILIDAKQEAKARSGVNKNCDQSNRGDELCDTGADPYSMNLDGDECADLEQWNDNCSQSALLLPSFPDVVGDITTPWDIPVRNIMSYYNKCRYEFTPFQYARMHDWVEGYPYLIQTTCEPPLQTCPDITILSDVLWQNQTIELCPNQKIIITSSGSLTIDNCILTRKVSNPQPPCLDLDFWEGIYIMGGHDEYTVPIGPGGTGGGQTIPATGYLKTMNNTIIEYSKNGIVAEQAFGYIELSNTTMRKNGRAVRAIQDITPGTPCSPEMWQGRGKVRLMNNTQILVEDKYNRLLPIHEVQVELVGTPTVMKGCTLKVVSTNNTYQQGIAVNSVGASLTINDESYIQNFEMGIYKDIDNPFGCGTGSGLVLEDSRIINCDKALINKCQNIRVIYNYIRGDVLSEGITLGEWYLNNIGAIDPINEDALFELTNPQLSNKIENNKFEQDVVRFRLDNAASYALCNVWSFPEDKDFNYIIANSGSSMPPSWGSFDSDGNSIASGNSHATDDVIMAKWGGLGIKNYEFGCPGCDEYYFSYQGVFESGVARIAHAECNQNWPNANGGGSDGNGNGSYNGNALDSMWNEYEMMISDLESELVSADSLTSIRIIEQLSWLRTEQGNVVGKVMFGLNPDSSSLWVDLWMNRTSYKIDQRRQIMDLLRMDKLSDLSALLAGLTTQSKDDAIDLTNLSDAITFLKNWQDEGDDIYALSFDKISVLVDVAELSYGDYTAVLRAFLNAYYGIRIVSPPEEIILNARPQESIHTSNRDKMTIIPNPSTGCFTLLGNEANEEIFVQIMDLSGQVMIERTVRTDREVCVNNLRPSVYIIKYNNIVSGKHGAIKLIIQ